MKACRSQKSNLRLDPIRLAANAWYYEEPEGLRVVQRLKPTGILTHETGVVLIPWWKVERSLARRNQKAKKK